MKTNNGFLFKRLLLALPPFLGLILVAWQGANRPEQLILGKWRVEAGERTIEFRPDGTYLDFEKGMVLAPHEYEPLRLRAQFWVEMGHYRFSSRRVLQVEPAHDRQVHDEEGLKWLGLSPEGAPQATPTPLPTATPAPLPAWAPTPEPFRIFCGTVSLPPPAARMQIAISNDAAEVVSLSGSPSTYGRAWKRIE